MYALSMDGKEIWSREMAGAIVDTPVLSEDGSVLFVGSMGKEMVALDTTAGDILWTFDLNGNLQSVWGSAVLVNNTLIFADSAGKIFGLDPDNGEPVWQLRWQAPLWEACRHERWLCPCDQRGTGEGV